LIIIGLETEDEKRGREEQEEGEDDEEDGRTEDENSNYEDAVMEEIDEEETNDDNENDITEVEDIPVQPEDAKKRGRPRGTTESVMEVRKQLMREEKEKQQKKQNIRRSERIKNQHLAMLVKDEGIPKTIREAKESNDWECWRQAMNEELKSMEEHEVWDIVPHPKNKRIIKCKWIFNIREDPGTKQRRYKAKLVALGCKQRPGEDYRETFAPVVRTETIRLLFSKRAGKQKNEDL